MMRASYWAYATRAGVCAIRCNPASGRCHVFLGDEDLGNYETEQHAIDALVDGRVHSSITGINTQTLGIPRDIAQWEFVPAFQQPTRSP